MPNAGSKLWPLINRSGLQRRIDGEVDNTDPFAQHRTVTAREEADLVEFCKELDRHGQGVNCTHLGAMVIDSLRLRAMLNRGREPATTRPSRTIPRRCSPQYIKVYIQLYIQVYIKVYIKVYTKV